MSGCIVASYIWLYTHLSGLKGNKKRTLRVTLPRLYQFSMSSQFGPPFTSQEIEVFNHLFTLWGDGNVFPASQASQLKSSGIPQQYLKYIWGFCSKPPSTYLTKDQFYLALRMIAMCQQRMDITQPMSFQMYTSLRFFWFMFNTPNLCVDPIPPTFQGIVCFFFLTICYPLL